MTGPLSGLRIIELAGIGPGPHAGMVLSDLGADVVRVVRPGSAVDLVEPTPPLLRGRTVVIADLKNERDRDEVLALVDRADALIEGYRPGVAERLGVGPGPCLERNPRLVYARMTGWGQGGPLAATAGHDINYISITGMLGAIGTASQPVPPLNMIGDYGGGSLFLVVGLVSALWERERSGRGQVIDTAMTDGVNMLAQLIHDLRGDGTWDDEREANLLDGGAPYYRTYACSDGRHVAVGAIEPEFYAELVRILELDGDALPDREDRGEWPALVGIFDQAFKRRTRDEWAAVFADTDACVTPVLSFAEAPDHPQIRARGSLPKSAVSGGIMANGAPRFSRTQVQQRPDSMGSSLAEARLRWS